MTFLEFVVTKLLGPADHEGKPGESFWPCPFRNHKEMVFHTLPSCPGQREYWRCHGCEIGGDEFQLIRSLRDQRGHPLCRGNWNPDHKRLVEEWRESQSPPAPASPRGPRWRKSEGATEHAGSVPSSRPVETVEAKRKRALTRCTTELFEALTLEELQLLARLYRFVQDYGLTMGEVAREITHFVEWVQRIDDRHRRDCDDDECEWVCCRRSRGPAPPTSEELELVLSRITCGCRRSS